MKTPRCGREQRGVVAGGAGGETAPVEVRTAVVWFCSLLRFTSIARQDDFIQSLR